MSDFICVKCLNLLGQVIVHTSQGPQHLVCPNPPNMKSDFEKLLVNHLVIDTHESSEVVRYKVKHRLDAIIDAHNQLVRLIELHIKQELTMERPALVAPQPAPLKSPQHEVLDVRKPVVSEVRTVKDFCLNCNHLLHKGICNALLDDDTLCNCGSKENPMLHDDRIHGRRTPRH